MKTSFLFAAALLGGAAQAQNAPLEIRAPLMPSAPTMDGKIEGAEWRGANRRLFVGRPTRKTPRDGLRRRERKHTLFCDSHAVTGAG